MTPVFNPQVPPTNQMTLKQSAVARVVVSVVCVNMGGCSPLAAAAPCILSRLSDQETWGQTDTSIQLHDILLIHAVLHSPHPPYLARGRQNGDSLD